MAKKRQNEEFTIAFVVAILLLRVLYRYCTTVLG